MARAYAGIVSPFIVIIVLLLQGATTPDYDPVRQTISELGTGWRGTAVVSLYGLIVLLGVVGPIMRFAPKTRTTALWVTAMVVIAIGCIGLSLVAAESWPWHSMTWRGRLHLIFAFGFVFAAIPVACLVASRALPESWRGLRRYSVITGLATLALLVATLLALGASPPSDYVSAHLGLIERAYVFAFLVWQCIVSTRLVRSAQTEIR